MDKYGVDTSSDKDNKKQASKKDEKIYCPICGAEAQYFGATILCPVHGSEPFEPR